ncbi:Gfo/Idh/MocA family protein [Paenibacillus guangzhouensis]|uniref:Gfo/Idh/MocA family protein n=1 Tax=Paenibacillus guangzhouensis TaxID=1473112 RepID=UPI001266BAB0|nr:Gfo/Idh/MocA family oxidoreductase [Paenibacillus guangzhouensis]
MEKKKLRVGIIGAGSIGAIHAEAYQSLAESEVLAITDVHLPLAQKVANTYGIEQVYERMEDLLDDERIDAVVVAVPNKFHESIAVAALEKGKHVMIEKPLAIDTAGARNIVKAQRTSGKVVMIPHQLRWDATALAVKEEAAKGSLGDIYYAKTGWFRRKSIPGWGSWFTQSALSGGGPLIDVGVHMLDLAIYLMGNPKPVSVFATTYAAFGERKLGIGSWGTPNWEGTFDVEDLATALIKFDNGASLQLEVSWAAHTVAEGNVSFLHLMGTEGGAVIQGNKGKFLMERFNRTADIEIAVPTQAEDSRVLLNRHFIDCIERGTEPMTSAYSGLTNLAIIEAIYESGKTGKQVDVNIDGELA